jgi:subtilisin family serine protease
MKRCAAVLLVVFAAVSALAQTDFDTSFRIEKADGTTVAIPMAAPPLDSVIVEFRDAPLAAAAARAGKTALPDYRAAFTRFREDLAAIEGLRRAGKTAVTADVRWEYFRLFNGASVRVARSDIDAIARLPYVKGVYADHEMRAMAGPAASQIGADKVWTSYGTRGSGVVVAIIDTGIDYNHEALGKGFGRGFKVASGYDFANKDDDPIDDNGHGTHVAGIIAGSSTTITGIAPEATLLAYKALHASGSGSESDVIAAMERAVDPNGDGDLSDHADVVNMSLGGAGGPDDPGARAVDNGTRAGIVFCIAAGNSGKFHSVSSPGAARTAITVGAVDSGDLIASFSSRGPTPQALTMKPEVAAPGVSILSSLPNNRYGPLSGTSMATPHVAGAAALLKAVHRDWTPAQIKNALMLNALAKTGQDAMAIGAGRIDVGAAAGSALSVDAASIDFGLDPIQQPSWSASRTIHLTNSGSQPRTLAVSTSGGTGVTTTLSAPALTLAPGETGEITLSIDVDNATATVSPQSLAGTGVIAISSAGVLVHVPWSFIKAVRATATWDREFASVLWLDAAHTTPFDAVPVADNASETLLATAGDYDVVVYGSTLDQHSQLTRASFIYLEAQHLDGDTTIATTEEEASHVIRGATPGADGAPLPISSDQIYALSGRLVFPPGGQLKSLTIPPLPFHELHINDVSSKNALLMNETDIDLRGNAIYALQHPAINGVSGDVTLVANNIASTPVQLLIPPALQGDVHVVMQVLPSAVPGETLPGVGVSRPIPGPIWKGTVYLTPDVTAPYSLGVSFNVITDFTVRYQTPLMHILDGEITMNTASTPKRFDAGGFIFGASPHVPMASFSAVTSALRPTISIDYFGPRGESRAGDRGRVTLTTFYGDGRQQTKTNSNPAALDFSVKGAYRIEVSNDTPQYPDLPAKTSLTMNVDSTRADYLPPTLTSLYLTDGAGMTTRTIPSHSASAIYFSAADYAYTPFRTYQPIRGDATALSYRDSGATAWTPLPITQMTEDPFAGFIYRADLSAVANVESARIDLKFDLTDNAGNTTSVVMQPAFSVGPEYPPRRRATP